MADTSVDPIPEGFHSLTPTLTIRGASDAIDFYKRAFGAIEHSRAIAPDGKSVWHADLQIGSSHLMLTDEFPDQGSHAPETTGAIGFSIWLYVPDVDAVYERAVSAGARAVMPVSDAFWGDRFGGLLDPFGHNWVIATRKRNLSEEEQRSAAEAFTASST